MPVLAVTLTLDLQQQPKVPATALGCRHRLLRDRFQAVTKQNSDTPARDPKPLPGATHAIGSKDSPTGLKSRAGPGPPSITSPGETQNECESRLPPGATSPTIRKRPCADQ